MINITQNKKYNPTEISGDLEIESSYNNLCVAISTFEDFKEIEPGTFEFINDGKEESWSLKSVTRGRLPKDDYLRVLLEVVPVTEDSCILKITFNRKPVDNYTVKFFIFLCVFAFAIGSWSIYLNIKETGSVGIGYIIFLYFMPFLFYGLSFFWFHKSGQVKLFERSFISQLEKRL